MSRSRPRSRGVSLIEAMVALAVLAFGTLAVLAVQASLRLNADIARQRSEAVRIAQEAIESARRFERLATYAALADLPATAVAGDTAANTVYRLTRSVSDAAEGGAAHPRRKTLVVDVAWTDRAGQAQSVRLAAAIAGLTPALAGSMAVPAALSLARHPGGRHPAIPPGAISWGDGHSRFDPPGGGGIGWIFDNLTADIVQVCAGAGMDSCVAFDARLLSGHVRFATATAAQPGAGNALVPPGTASAVGVTVAQTAPFEAAVACHAQAPATTGVAYYCALPVGAAAAWSGRALVLGLTLAGSVADADAGARRVCRYTPYRGSHPLAPGGMPNEEHPLDYAGVTGPLVHQNFLVVRAGDGGIAYNCPGDLAGDDINTNTWHHQPAG